MMPCDFLLSRIFIQSHALFIYRQGPSLHDVFVVICVVVYKQSDKKTPIKVLTWSKSINRIYIVKFTLNWGLGYHHQYGYIKF